MSGWIAELRQRLGIKAPEASPPAPAGAAPDKEPPARQHRRRHRRLKAQLRPMRQRHSRRPRQEVDMKQLRATLGMALLLSRCAAVAGAQAGKPPAGAAADQTPRPEDLEPGVDTSKTAPSAPPAAESAAPAATPRRQPPLPAGARGQAGRRARRPGAHRLRARAPARRPARKARTAWNLRHTEITGNRELPKVHVHRALEALGPGRSWPGGR